MRKNDANESIFSDYNINESNKYLIYDVVETIRSFFRAYFADAIKIDASIQSPSYIFLKGRALAYFFKEAIKLNKGENILHIYITDTDNVLNIVIGTKNGMEINKEHENNLYEIARIGDFGMEIAEGKIIICHKLEKIDSITVRSMDSRCPLYDDFKEVFFGL